MIMLRKILGSANFYLGTALSLMYATRELRYHIKKFGETETVYNERQYVMVRLARGDYNNSQMLSMMKTDYKFYKTISKFND
jgi:hypothetical protein